MRTLTYRRLTWTTGINGGSVAGLAALALLVALVAHPGWIEMLAAACVLVSGWLEIRGCLFLKAGRVEGLSWARWSQVGVFASIMVYSVLQYIRLTPETALSQLSPEMSDFLMSYYDLDEWMLGQLLYMVGQATYVTLVAASMIYQGGLYWYYSRSLRRLARGDSGSAGPA